uniref:Uncharacterized protein n=1 Tax=Magallana gigas TaxID=29159 RepID=K1P5N0_MAGGI
MLNPQVLEDKTPSTPSPTLKCIDPHIFASQRFSVHLAPHKPLGLWGAKRTENPRLAKMRPPGFFL